MDLLEDDNDVEVVPLDVPMDNATIMWLARLCRVTGARPAAIVASMLRDIRVDDEASHRLLQ
jgi:hypothetical protein